MALKFIYITNDPTVASIAENVGVERIMVDMEYIGKVQRQQGMDCVLSNHTINDVRKIRTVLSHSDLVVRINPIHGETTGYPSSEEEIESVIACGADYIMLPYFQTAAEVKTFISCLDGRKKNILLLETISAVRVLDEILSIDGIDEIHIGLNDLSLSMGKSFMFEVLADGTVEKIATKIKKAGIPFGFGGIASIGKGLLPAEYILGEHYRLGSESVILSRSFCDTGKIHDYAEIRRIFSDDIQRIRKTEERWINHPEYFNDNTQQLKTIVKEILDEQKKQHHKKLA